MTPSEWSHSEALRTLPVQEGFSLVILIGGGTKKRQAIDIAAAKQKWDRVQEAQEAGGEVEWH